MQEMLDAIVGGASGEDLDVVLVSFWYSVLELVLI
jgi:hypothetical protein